MVEECPYCGVLDRLRTNSFFSHPVCDICVREWYEAGRELMPADLRALSLEARQATAAHASPTRPPSTDP